MSDTTSPSINEEGLLTIDQAAEHLNVSNMTVRRLVERGELPVYRFVRRMRFKLSDIRELLAPKLVASHQEDVQAPPAVQNPVVACHCADVVVLLRDLSFQLDRILAAEPPAEPKEVGVIPRNDASARGSGINSENLTFPEVAGMLRVSAMTVRRLADNGALPCMRVARRRFIRRSDVEQFLKGTAILNR